MRLVRLDGGGNFSLVERVGNNIPQYAILSHTWGEDEEEVTFRDIVAGTGGTKPGYRKIRFCGKQAARDNLEFFWVDTCCIDKASSAELSEAINSMFRWYQEAAKCYVYLSDVSIYDWKSHKALQKSRWFTRGWTLQELVAPRQVEFFSCEGERIGDKSLLLHDIQEFTGISIKALQGCPLSQFSFDERMSWTRKRQTKREEDAAYCLFGIFDVHMPLLYGEGRNKAFLRLQKEVNESIYNRQPAKFPVSVTEAVESTEGFLQYHISGNGLGNQLRESQNIDAQGRILDSLRFPQIQHRQHHVLEAHEGTYQWIFNSVPNQSPRWHSLTAWLSSSKESRRIYWIHGKPGSGKSTMMRFLDQNIVTSDHMLPWAEGRMVLTAQYFFWNPGTTLQKSVTGLLRTLLMQLLEKQPRLIPRVVHQRKWASARTPDIHSIDWTIADLQNTLYEYIRSVRSFAKVFILLDGLDELDGPDDAQSELIGLLINLAGLENVKICLSSRPWNIFRDAFGNSPQLRLEDLTHGDISTYVQAQLYSHIRFRDLLRLDRGNAERLVLEVTNKAAGVFLWVRIVVRELSKGIRDGESIQMLQKRLDGIPADMDEYFATLMDSISLDHRQEASALLQIALYVEHDFQTLHSLRLIELSFIDEGRPDFIRNGRYNFTDLDLTDREALQFRLDSTVRRLNSRCMGLLECRYHPQNDEPGLLTLSTTRELSQDPQHIEIARGQIFEPSTHPLIYADHSNLLAFSLTIDFFHRSCRDFLLTPKIQDLLHQYTHGPYDARMFLLNSRVAYFMSLAIANTNDQEALTVASHVLSSLARPSYKLTPLCAALATVIEPMLERLAQNQDLREEFWYIYPSIISWSHEQSSFLTLAIDFELSSYVRMHLTPKLVQGKRGRPILDYILRPRFPFPRADWMKIGNQRPHLELLRIVLHFGANPNESYGPASVWALYLCFLADVVACGESYWIPLEYFGALEVLIRAGAAPILHKSWLSSNSTYTHYNYDPSSEHEHMSPEDRFSYRWPAAVGSNPALGKTSWCAVRDLLEQFRVYSGWDVDSLRDHLPLKNTISI